jgi:putative transposase
MSNLRRYNSCGRPYFITNVVYQRQPILITNIDLFWRAMDNTRLKYPCDLIAWVILPDHYHLLIDTGTMSISSIIHDFKLSFSSYYRKRVNIRSGKVWQLRFWDHIIRDERDFNRHLDYIHYNPVKHGLVEKPLDYTHTSIHKHREYYQDGWGIREAIDLKGEFGE